jgi:chromosome segregation ATPase
VYLSPRHLSEPRIALEDGFKTASRLELEKRQLVLEVERLERRLEEESQAIAMAVADESEAKAAISTAERDTEALLARRTEQLSHIPQLEEETQILQAEFARLEGELTHIEKINSHIVERKAILQQDIQTLNVNLRMARQKSRANWRKRLAVERNMRWLY